MSGKQGCGLLALALLLSRLTAVTVVHAYTGRLTLIMPGDQVRPSATKGSASGLAVLKGKDATATANQVVQQVVVE